MEGVSFLGARMPKSVIGLSHHINGLDKQIFRFIVQVIVSSIEGKEIPDNALSRVNDTCEKDLEHIYAGLYTIIRAALKIPQNLLKTTTFQDDLKTLKIPTDFIEDLTNVIYGKKRNSLDKANLIPNPSLAKLTRFKWRIDVTISTSYLSRVLQPTILIDLTLSNGKKHIFEVSISKFHLLRYNVATLLKQIDDIEKRSVIKQQD